MATGRADQHSVREHNLSLVMRHLSTLGPRSRARIATETGLNKSTVSSLIAELIERGLVRESGRIHAGAVGRPARSVQIAGDTLVGLGLEIGEGHLAACAVDLGGAIRFRSSTPLDNRTKGPHRALEALAEVAKEALGASVAQGLTTVGVIVAVPGLVDRQRRLLHLAPNLGWAEVDIAGELAGTLGELGVSLNVENDANLAALAEMRDGVCRGRTDFVYLYGEAGAGVGAGIVSGGELFRGQGGLGGEVGHMPLNRRGPVCRCGNRGCVEVSTGLVALLELAGIVGFDYRDGSAQAELVRRAEAGDRDTEAALGEVARTLALAVVALANVLNPSAIVLGGYFASVGRWLAPRLQREVDQHALAARWSRCEVLVSELGPEAALRGGAALALQEVLAHPVSIGEWSGE
jgi:predicted NBD/HSP70 family sugar kinase